LFPKRCTLRVFQVGNEDAILTDSITINSDNHYITENLVTYDDAFIILNISKGFLCYYISTAANVDVNYESIKTNKVQNHDKVIKTFKCSDYNDDVWFKVESSPEKRWKSMFDASVFCSVLINDMYPNVTDAKFGIEDYEVRQVKVSDGGFELIVVLAVSLLYS